MSTTAIAELPYTASEVLATVRAEAEAADRAEAVPMGPPAGRP